MEEKQSLVESYVPAAAFYEGKREAAGKLFRDRFAVADATRDFSVLAFRGRDLQIGEPISMEQNHRRSVRFAIENGQRVLAETGKGSALFFGDRSFSGLVPVLLLPEPFSDLAACAKLLLHGEIVAIGAVEGREPGKRELNELCLRFSEALAECEGIFSEQSPEQFRRHAARIAAFAGCRADFSALPFDSYELSEADVRKWTLLLLCLFLSLRGAESDEPHFTLREVGRETIFPGVDLSAPQNRKKRQGERFSFLDHPAFRNVELEATPEGLRLSVVLSKAKRQGELSAVAPATRFCFLLEAA